MAVLYFFQEWKDEQHLKKNVFAVWAREVIPPPLVDSDDDSDNEYYECESCDFVPETAHVRRALRQAFDQADVELADLQRREPISSNDWLNLLTIVNTALQLTSYGGMLGGWEEQGDRAHAKKLASDVDYLRFMYEKSKQLYCKFDKIGRETKMGGDTDESGGDTDESGGDTDEASRDAEYGGDTNESWNDDRDDDEYEDSYEDVDKYLYQNEVSLARAQYDLARAQYCLAHAQCRLVREYCGKICLALDAVNDINNM